VSTSATAPPLIFGIYPGGPAATNGPAAPVVPENPAARLSALEQLRGSSRLVLHIYAGYSGPGSSPAAAQVGSEIAAYTAAGFQVELVLTYRPADRDAAIDVPGYVRFVRQTVDSLGSNPGLVSLQVTNEANLTGAANTSDGAYPGAQDALIQGVIAARAQATADGFSALSIGFNWSDAGGPAADAFWSYLGRTGGATFAKAVDWVGIDDYPYTWGASPPAGVSLANAVAGAIDSALAAMRTHFMALAGLPATVPIHVSETGYPTGPGRTPQMQAQALQGLVQTVYADRGTYNVTNFNWFDLRDSNSSSPSFQSQFGLTTDSYTPKPAFGVYQQLIATL
jgi:hypothetical protein